MVSCERQFAPKQEVPSLSEQIEIGVARPQDAEAVAKISRDIVERGLPWNWTPRRVARAIRDPDTEVIVARDRGRVVGFAIMKLLLDEAHLLLFAVEGSHQRRGLGRALIEWLEIEARTAGVMTIYLEVRATNTKARAFYRSLGYVDVRVRRRYYSGLEDAVLMANHLAVMPTR